MSSFSQRLLRDKEESWRQRSPCSHLTDMETPYNNCLQTEQRTERDTAHDLACLMNTGIHLFSSTGLCFSWMCPCIRV